MDNKCIQKLLYTIPVLGLLLFSWTSPAQIAGRLDIPGLDAYIAQARMDWQIPGLAIAVVKNDSTLLMKGYGHGTANENNEVNVETVFTIPSNTKAFTATALAMLVDEGKISWDDSSFR